MPGLSDLLNPQSTEEWIKHFQLTNPGPDTEDAFRAAQATRQAADAGKADPRQRDLNLRDAEHALFSQTMVDQSPVLGRLQTLVTVPGYSAAKTLQQSYPATAPLIKAITGMDFSGSTRPDLRELYWGMRPVFKSVRQ